MSLSPCSASPGGIDHPCSPVRCGVLVATSASNRTAKILACAKALAVAMGIRVKRIPRNTTATIPEQGAVLVSMGSVVAVSHKTVLIEAAFRTGIYIFSNSSNRVTDRVLVTEGSTHHVTLTEAPSKACWRALGRAHTPLYHKDELEQLLYTNWSQHTKLLVLDLDGNDVACALHREGQLWCTECKRPFTTIEEWAKHFNDPPLQLPHMIAWKEVVVSNGELKFRKKPHVLLGKQFAHSPRPHSVCHEGSLSDTSRTPTPTVVLTNKLEKIHSDLQYKNQEFVDFTSVDLPKVTPV